MFRTSTKGFVEVHYLLGNFVTALLGVLNIYILARVLPPSKLGQYSLFVATVFFAVMVGTSWMNETYIRYFKEEKLLGIKDDRSEAHRARQYFLLVGLGFISILYLLFSGYITEFIGVNIQFIFLIIFAVCVQSILVWQQGYYRVNEHNLRSAYLMAIQRLLFFIFLLLLLWTKSDSIENVLLLFVLSSVIVGFASFGPFKFVVGTEQTVSREVAKKYYQHALPFFWGGICLYVVNYVDIMMINIFTDQASVGIYSVMYSAFSASLLLVMSINTVFVSKLVERRQAGLDVLKWYGKVVVVCCLLVLAFVCVAIIMGGFVIDIALPPAYGEGLLPFQILIVSVFFYVISTAANPLFTVYDVTKYFFLISAVRALANLVGDLFLVPKYGMTGAAIGTVFSFAVAAIVSVFCIGLNFKRFSIPLTKTVKSDPS